MSADEQKAYRTLRGWLAGSEPDEETYFAHSASVRIFGTIADMDQITRTLGLVPTLTYRRGERRGERSPPYRHDMWLFSPPLPESAPLEDHIDALWSALRPNRDYLLDLKRALTVDVFLGYRSNCDHAGIEIPYTSLAMFVGLQIPFGVSIVIA